jgi:hypothetical protein
MKPPRWILGLALAVTFAAGGPASAEEKASPEFDRIKVLAGQWEGTAKGHGSPDKGMPTVATIRVVSAGSAVMLTTDPGTAHEMVTMFHRDDGATIATHYCSAMNQPRMKAEPSTDPAKLAFEFVDGTNLKAHPGHMQRLVLNMAGTDRHIQEWTFNEAGKTNTMVFEMKRKK